MFIAQLDFILLMPPCSQIAVKTQHSVKIADTNDGHNDENETRVVINQNYPLKNTETWFGAAVKICLSLRDLHEVTLRL